MICSSCDEPILHGEKTASGPDGIVHFACFKREAVQGREISLISLMEEIGHLKRRVQRLEQTVEFHDRNIDFRIGGTTP